MKNDINVPVGIIGAGPVGLSLALRLSDFGIGSVVFDDNPELKKEGSKACLIQGDVLEILDKSGCARQIYDEGIRWTHSNVYIGGTPINRAHYPSQNRFGPFVNISQYRIEQILLDEIARRPDIRVEFSSRVVGVEQSADHATLTVESAGEADVRSFRYVVACNGVRSNIRELVGLKWNGYRHTSQFLITDIKVKLPLPKERHFHFDPPFNRGYQVIMHPQPDDVWRIDWQLPPDVDVENDKRTGEFERRIRSVIGDLDYRLEWDSVYRFQQRILERFVKGRVIFAGDAAHALPPYGSRGMNSGIQDADNLAWKLALVLDGAASPALLDTYDVERSAAARENIDVTEKTIQFMVPSTWVAKARRQVLFSLAKRYGRFRRYVNSGTMAKPHRYIASSLVQPADTSTTVGVFSPDATLDDGRSSFKLREKLGKGFTFVYVGKRAPTAVPDLRQSKLRMGKLELNALVLMVDDAPSASSREADRDPVAVVRADASILQHFEQDKWHLVRPDLHISGVYGFARADHFDQALAPFGLTSDQPHASTATLA